MRRSAVTWWKRSLTEVSRTFRRIVDKGECNHYALTTVYPHPKLHIRSHVAGKDWQVENH